MRHLFPFLTKGGVLNKSCSPFNIHGFFCCWNSTSHYSCMIIVDLIIFIRCCFTDNYLLSKSWILLSSKALVFMGFCFCCSFRNWHLPDCVYIRKLQLPPCHTLTCLHTHLLFLFFSLSHTPTVHLFLATGVLRCRQPKLLLVWKSMTSASGSMLSCEMSSTLPVVRNPKHALVQHGAALIN